MCFYVILIQIEGNGPGNCSTDYLEIFDGPSLSSAPMGKLCGLDLKPPDLVSAGNSLTAKFFSDSVGNEKGFHLEFESGEISGKT